MKNAFKLTFVAVAAFLLAGCPSETLNPYLRETGFKIGGYSAASKAIEHHPRNVEAVVGVAEVIDAILKDKTEEILFAEIEEWYAEIRPTLKVDEIELALLEELFIFPLWEKLQQKYGGKVLKISNPKVKGDLLAFKQGLELAI